MELHSFAVKAFRSNVTDWLAHHLITEDKRAGVAEFDIRFDANGPTGGTHLREGLRLGFSWNVTAGEARLGG